MNRSIAVITGASDGIGLEAAKGLLEEGFYVIGVGRNEEKCQRAERELKEKYGDNIKFFTAELSLLKNAKELYRKITDYIKQIEGSLTVLINNAGCYVAKKTVTEEGFEKTQAVNYLTPFLLSHLFMPQLKASKQGKIINTGSRSHYHNMKSTEQFTAPKFYFGYFGYMRSKLNITMMTKEINQRFGGDDFRCFIADPGLVNTFIIQKSQKGLSSAFWSLRKKLGVTPREGAATAVYLAKEHLSNLKYHYYYLCQEKKPSSLALNAEKCKSLYDATYKIISPYLE